jgi:hypothetical protein
VLQHGTAPMQKQLLSGLFGDSIAFAGAWLQYGFHEVRGENIWKNFFLRIFFKDGALSGAIAARNVLSDAKIPILRPSHPLCHAARPVWVRGFASHFLV